MESIIILSGELGKDGPTPVTVEVVAGAYVNLPLMGEHLVVARATLEKAGFQILESKSVDSRGKPDPLMVVGNRQGYAFVR